MNDCNRVTALALAAALTVSLCGCAVGNKAENAIISESRYIGQARGFLVETGDGGDFPARADSVQTQQELLKELVTVAVENKLNTIFFEARPGATTYYNSKQFPTDRTVAKGEKEPLDPLGFLCQAAALDRLQVFAVIDPFAMTGSLPDGARNPFEGVATSGDQLDPGDETLQKLTAQSAAELAKNYPVGGIVLDGLEAPSAEGGAADPAVEALVREVSKAVRQAAPGVTVAVAFDAASEQNSMTVEVVERLCRESVISMVIPKMSAVVDDLSQNGYLAVLNRWTAAKLGSADLYTLNRDNPESPYELHNQLLANALSGKVAGAVLAPYSLLAAADTEQNELLVSLLSAGRSQPKMETLAIPQQLAITYPLDGATVYDQSIFVMGTSDPGQPLTVNGETVTRMGTAGTFGVELPLEIGENAIALTQGNQSTAVKVTRGSAPAPPAPITKITAATLFPTTPLGVDSNETIAISCVGPGGGSITATLDGQTVVLTQTGTGTAGMPATFKGSVSLNPANYPADKVTNAGVITYVMTHNDAHEVQKSEGSVFVAGREVPLVLEVSPDTYVVSALTDLASDDNFTQSLKSGARAAVVGKTTATRNGNPVLAYKLSSGNYLLGSHLTIVEDAAKCAPEITEIVKSGEADWEEYAFRGGQPAVLTDYRENKLTLRFLDTKLTADPNLLTGGLVQSLERTDTKDGVELTLTFEPGALWGYDVTHGEEATTLYLRRTPQRSQTFGKPLEGISILLDPGHGGPDPGALGVAGQDAPTEAVLNLAAANAVKFRLEQLGAVVTMTRTDEDIKVSLDERIFQAQTERPHLFIALHHNSAALVKDLNEVRRMEAYYWETIAQPLANQMMTRLTQTMGRTPSDPENAYYYVTRLTFAPAVLFEMGFVVNPAEYEDACGTPSRLKAANGVAMAVTEIIPGTAAPDPTAESSPPAESSAVSQG